MIDFSPFFSYSFPLKPILNFINNFCENSIKFYLKGFHLSGNIRDNYLGENVE